MKTVFTNAELPHIWASGTQANGRSNSMHFEGAALFSYQTVIARRIVAKGRKAYVLDWASFSNSTSKHQSLARRAIPQADPVFKVRIGRRCQTLDLSPADLRDWFMAEFRREETSRYAHMRARDFRRRFEALSEARRVCAVFGLADSALAKIAGKLAAEYESAGAVVEEHRATLETRRQTLWANRRADLR